ncbi:MAG: DUF4347 domain-containing protein, partial [Phormidesmis sp. CAN_BIN44]|nr:DUF4347 domain-containing protein [Phormidesmis sp. CAN_BIN44]
MLATDKQVNSQLFESTANSSGAPASLLSRSLNPLELPVLLKNGSSNPQTIAFVDSAISDAMTVMANTQADIRILLDPTQDGIDQITKTLGYYKNLKGIDIVSHGNVAEFQLGSSFLSANSLKQYAYDLRQWSSSLAPGADILIYGCNVAAGETGQAFVKEISTLTDADIAASTNPTGDSSKGGDWTLEYTTGSIETATPFTDSLMSNYQGLLATLFTTQTPTQTNITDGAGSAGDYELGMEFRGAKAGTIDAIRYYKAASETGTHTGKIWSSTGTLLTSVTFSNETASGWQQHTLATPLSIQANKNYVISVNANCYYVATAIGIATT